MASTSKLAERFPSIFKSWDENSVIFKFLDGFGKQFDESQKNVRHILRGHWIDTARGSDIDQLGALFNLKRVEGESDSDFRERIKNSIQQYRGGGTVGAIRSSLKGLLGNGSSEKIELLENPPQKMEVERIVRAGDTWTMRSESIQDVKPVLRLKVLEEGAEAKNPTLTNTITGEKISYEDSLKTGEELVVREGKATLDKTSVTKKISGTKEILLPRKYTTWQYTEALSEKIAVFDAAAFDGSIFAVGIPEVSITFQWTASRPATFELHVPKEVLTRNGVSQQQVEKLVNSVKAAGVTATVKVTE